MEYVVKVPIERLLCGSALENVEHLVTVVHKTRLLASKLLNLSIRRDVERERSCAGRVDFRPYFEANWIKKAFVGVSGGRGRVNDPRLERVLGDDMPPHRPEALPPGADQAFMYAARNVATTAATHVWFHLKDRVRRFVMREFKLPWGAYRALDADARKERARDLKLVCLDVLRLSDQPMRSPPEYHKWVEIERNIMQIDAISTTDVLAIWTPLKTDGCPGMGFYAKNRPHLFVMAMVRTLEDRKKSGSLYPECRTCVPGYVHIDSRMISALVRKKEKTRKRGRDTTVGKKEKRGRHTTGDKKETRKRGRDPSIEPPLPSTEPNPSGRQSRRKKDDPELQAEKHSIFAGSERDVLHPEVHKAIPRFWERFSYSFDTDGVAASVHMRRRGAPAGGAPPSGHRSRGHWCARTTKWVAADELPAHGLFASAEEFRERTGWSGGSGDACIVGIDPGVIEIISAVAIDTAAHIKYTNRQRRVETGVVVNMRRLEREKPGQIQRAEVSLSAFDSRALGFQAYLRYCAESLRTVERRLQFYGDITYRRRRWKMHLMRQVSESKLFKAVERLRPTDDERPLLLAYGAWGLKPGTICRKGNPPALGVGMARALSKQFRVIWTPEYMTSKTCLSCLSRCGRCSWIESTRPRTARGRVAEIRGLRQCLNPACGPNTGQLGHLFNRDRMGATNIGRNLARLLDGRPLISAPQGLDTDLLDLDAELHNN